MPYLAATMKAFLKAAMDSHTPGDCQLMRVGGAWNPDLFLGTSVNLTSISTTVHEGTLIGDHATVVANHSNNYGIATPRQFWTLANAEVVNETEDSYTQIGTTDAGIILYTDAWNVGIRRMPIMPANWRDYVALGFEPLWALCVAYNSGNPKICVGQLTLGGADNTLKFSAIPGYEEWFPTAGEWVDSSGMLIFVLIGGQTVGITATYNGADDPDWGVLSASLIALDASITTASLAGFDPAEDDMWTARARKIATIDQSVVERVLTWAAGTLFTAKYGEGDEFISTLDPDTGVITPPTDVINSYFSASITTLSAVQIPVALAELGAVSPHTFSANDPVLAVSTGVVDSQGYNVAVSSFITNNTTFGYSLQTIGGEGADAYWGEDDALRLIVGNAMVGGKLATLVQDGTASVLETYNTFPTLGANGVGTGAVTYSHHNFIGLTVFQNYAMTCDVSQNATLQALAPPSSGLTDFAMVASGATGNFYSIAYRRDTGTALEFTAAAQATTTTDLYEVLLDPPTTTLDLTRTDDDLTGAIGLVTGGTVNKYSTDGGVTYTETGNGGADLTFTITGGGTVNSVIWARVYDGSTLLAQASASFTAPTLTVGTPSVSAIVYGGTVSVTATTANITGGTLSGSGNIAGTIAPASSTLSTATFTFTASGTGSETITVTATTNTYSITAAAPAVTVGLATIAVGTPVRSGLDVVITLPALGTGESYTVSKDGGAYGTTGISGATYTDTGGANAPHTYAFRLLNGTDIVGTGTAAYGIPPAPATYLALGMV